MGLNLNTSNTYSLRSELQIAVQDQKLSNTEYQELKQGFIESQKSINPNLSDSELETMFQEKLKSYIGLEATQQISEGTSEAVTVLELDDDNDISPESINLKDFDKLEIKDGSKNSFKFNENPEYNFKNTSETFQQLVRMAQESRTDDRGRINIDDKIRLEEFAKRSGGTLTFQEELFISSLSIDKNMTALKSEDFNSSDFKFEVYDIHLREKSHKAWDEATEWKSGDFDESNPLNSEISDIGKTKLYTPIREFRRKNESEAEAELIQFKAGLDSYLSEKPELKATVDSFLEKLNSFEGETSSETKVQNYEALILIKNLISDRNPPLEDYKIKQILDKLTDMLGKDYDSRVGSSKELVLSTLHDVSMPENISQRDVGTCGAACIQIQLALRNPTEYLNMVDTLAQNKSYTTLSGDTIPPNMTFLDDTTNRSVTSGLIQNAIMDFANGTKAFDSKNKIGTDGLYEAEEKKALNSILNTHNYAYNSANYTSEQLLSVLQRSNPSEKFPITIGMTFSETGRDSFHFVNVVSIDDKNVKIINPWGREETFSLDKLKSRIFSVYAPPGKATQIPKLSSQEFKKEINDNPWYTGTNGISNTIINQGDKFLDKLYIKQKAYILKELVDGNTTSRDKRAIKTVLDSVLSGTEGQNKQSMMVLQDELKKLGLSLYDVLNEVKENSFSFLNLAYNVHKSLITDENAEWKIADLIVTGSKKSREFISSLSDGNLGLLAKGISNRGDEMADNPKLAARMIKGLYELTIGLTSREEIHQKFLSDLKKFQRGINDDWDTGDVVKELNKLEPGLAQKIAQYTNIAFEND